MREGAERRKGNSPTGPSDDPVVAALVVRRLIRSTPEWLFAAWTEPAQLSHWWGPEGASCAGVELDLAPGGRYRIGNRMPDGSLVWIAGVFEAIEPPHRLVYTWRLESQPGEPERVTVTFDQRGAMTEVTVVHERIAAAQIRISHERGWIGCLDGLARYAEQSTNP